MAGIVKPPTVGGTAQPAQPVRASDLVGCRYRLRQRRAHPDTPELPDALLRQPQIDAGRAAVFDALPVKRAVGDGRGKAFTRIDIDPGAGVDARVVDTRLALKRRAHLITNAALEGEIDGAPALAEVDILVRTDRGYAPVIISNHRVAREHPTNEMLMVPTARLGLGRAMTVKAKGRHHTVDGYRLAMAHVLLGTLADGRGGAVGQDRARVYVVDPARYVPQLREALAVEIPDEPKRMKQCASCRFWPLCSPRLEELDDISLLLPGGRGDVWREEGITTVQSLIDDGPAEPAALARAWRAGIPVLRREKLAPVPRADVEIDIDMEAYLDQGAYLWGAYDGEEYRAFVTWEDVGGAAEEANFNAFWSWLMQRRRDAREAGQTFRAYCYAAGGENHWLRSSARRFASVDEAEVAEFIASEDWVDVFALVRRSLVGTDGLGLKVLGPVVGFAWEDDDVDGERSVALRRAGRLGDIDARDMLIRYNEDDCLATRAVRDFLDAGAPGVPRLGEV